MTKTKPSLLPPKAIMLAAECMTRCAQKYPGPRWKEISVEDHVDALRRHMYQWLDGDRLDDETEMSHLVHVLCRAMMAVSRENEEGAKIVQHGDDDFFDSPDYEKWLEEQDRKLSKGKPPERAKVGDWIEITEYEFGARVGDVVKVTHVDEDNAHYDWDDCIDLVSRHGYYQIFQHAAPEKTINDFPPSDWDKAAVATKPVWSHSSGDWSTCDSKGL